MPKNDKEVLKRRLACCVLESICDAVEDIKQPMIPELVEEYGRDPFLVLVGCLLSLRTKDEVTIIACRRLFSHALAPVAMIGLKPEEIEGLIYPVGFYRKKAKLLITVSTELIERFDGKVPETQSELLSIKGIGRKTSELVRGEGFGFPAICVDTHVHRIANRIGLVDTASPNGTETELKKILPESEWNTCNRVIIPFGKKICTPISPFCSKCPLSGTCAKKGVKKSR